MPRDVARAAALAAELHTRAGRRAEAQVALKAGLSIAGGGPQAGLAMRLTLSVAEEDTHAYALRGVLFDLSARLSDQVAEVRRRSTGRREPVTRLLAALDATRALETARYPAQVREALAPWADPKAVEGLDP